MTPTEEIKLIKKARLGDRKAESLLLDFHAKYLDAISRNFNIPGYSYEDIQQIARISFIRAIETFALDRNTKFTTHTYNTITGHLKNTLRSVVGRNKGGSFATSDSVSYRIADPNTNFGNGFLPDQEEKAWESLFCNDIEDNAYSNLLIDEILKNLQDGETQKVFLLKLEGYTLQEICEETNIDRNKVFTLLGKVQSVTAQSLAN